MPAPPFPPDEDARLKALHQTGIINAGRDAILDRIVLDAAREADTPIALITFVDKDHQWFKSKVGLELDSTPRHSSFCAWAIYNAEVLWVEDATADERFSDNPLVHADPNIRHYAGVPVQTPDGYLLGTLCVLDRAPRPYDCDVVERLKRLSQEVSTAIARSADEPIRKGFGVRP